MANINLNDEDPTVFAGCPKCNRRGTGVIQGKYYGKAFTSRRWSRGPRCENCKTRLVKMHETVTN